MQILKEEIRTRIKKSALHLFANKGFKETTIADVASKAEISVGNIYNYYPTKKKLFAEMIPTEVMEEFKDLLSQRFIGKGTRDFVPSNIIIQTVIRYRYQFIILMEMSEVTEYSDIKRDLISHCIKMYAFYLKRNFDKTIDLDKYRQLLEAVYSNVLYAIVAVCKGNYTPEVLAELMQKILAYHLSGIRRMTKML